MIIRESSPKITDHICSVSICLFTYSQCTAKYRRGVVKHQKTTCFGGRSSAVVTKSCLSGGAAQPVPAYRSCRGWKLYIKAKPRSSERHRATVLQFAYRCLSRVQVCCRGSLARRMENNERPPPQREGDHPLRSKFVHHL